MDAIGPIASHMVENPPPTVYQTMLKGSSQDSSTTLRMTIGVTDETEDMMRAHDGGETVFCTMRRFDGEEIEAYSERRGKMVGMRVSQAAFKVRLERRTVVIEAHRKELPVSSMFGGAPFVFVFLIAATGEIVTTTPFITLSKTPRVPAEDRRPPKRIRGPPPRRPTFSDAVGAEAEVNRKIRGNAALDTLFDHPLFQ